MFSLPDSEEVLRQRVVKTVALAGQTLKELMFGKTPFRVEVRILPSSIGAKYQSVRVVEPGKSFVGHILPLVKMRTSGDIVGYNLSVEPIQDRGEIEFESTYVYLRDICSLLTIWLLCHKVAHDYVGRNFTGLSP